MLSFSILPRLCTGKNVTRGEHEKSKRSALSTNALSDKDEFKRIVYPPERVTFTGKTTAGSNITNTAKADMVCFVNVPLKDDGWPPGPTEWKTTPMEQENDWKQYAQKSDGNLRKFK